MLSFHLILSLASFLSVFLALLSNVNFSIRSLFLSASVFSLSPLHIYCFTFNRSFFLSPVLTFPSCSCVRTQVYVDGSLPTGASGAWTHIDAAKAHPSRRCLLCLIRFLFQESAVSLRGSLCVILWKLSHFQQAHTSQPAITLSASQSSNISGFIFHFLHRIYSFFSLSN